MKVYIVYWQNINENLEFTRVYPSEELAEECVNYINSLRPNLRAYYLEQEVNDRFTEQDKAYFNWNSTL